MKASSRIVIWCTISSYGRVSREGWFHLCSCLVSLCWCLDWAGLRKGSESKPLGGNNERMRPQLMSFCQCALHYLRGGIDVTSVMAVEEEGCSNAVLGECI